MTTLPTVLSARIHQNQWSLESVFPQDHAIASQYWAAAPPRVITNFRLLLSRDVFSEGDAQSLYDYVLARRSEMSPAFLAMLSLWLEDELKHYEALRRVYHCLAGVSFAEMDERFAARVHEIEPIQRVLTDEFTILVTFMFDEIGSVYSYRRDLWEYYRHFGPEIQRIGHHLVQDEGMHFNNAAELLLSLHAHRLAEVEPLLAEITALEVALGRYYKTFFLDHAQEQYRFPKHFNAVISQLILARLGLGERPPQVALKELWQWVPAGAELIPIVV
jgi:hypothetical protein